MLPPTNWARMASLAPIALALGSCAYIAGVNEPARAGYAHISVPRLVDGRPSVTVFRVHSKKGLFVQLDLPSDEHEVASFALKPGDHTLEVACLRPNAVDVVDGLWSFNVTVEANESYVLDCTPTKAKGQNYFENHFALSKVESRMSLASAESADTRHKSYELMDRQPEKHACLSPSTRARNFSMLSRRGVGGTLPAE